MKRHSAFEHAALAICWLLVLAGLLVTSVYFSLASSARQTDGSVSLPELQHPVRVWADSFGIPHVFAVGELDALRAQGYVHAMDRLWQMEFFRRVGAGRLAELFGESMLPTDRFLRTLDLWGAAGRAVERLDPAERERLRAYAEGVNARLGERERPLPPEFRLLRLKPEPWDEQSSLAIGIVMNLDLSHWRNDLSRYWASRNLSADKLSYLSLGYPAWGPTILDESLARPTEHEAARRPRQRATGGGETGTRPRSGLGAAEALSVLRALRGMSLRVASNAWVLAGERTDSGHPILANDMHLGLRSPALWYLAGLHASSDGLDVAGLTLPGIPGVVVGYNRDVAWGFTNGMVDDMDFVVEEVDAEGTRYRDGEGWIPFKVRQELIPVRGRSVPEVWAVRETVRGPVVSDVLPGLDATLSAVWVAARPTAVSIGLSAMNRARDLEEFDRAVRDFAQPHQNIVFASRDGRIGYRLGGRIPLRRVGDGSLPVSQAAFGHGWPGVWPPDAHPAGADPDKGYFVTANNLQAPGLGAAVSADYAAPFRASRITEVLEARSDWSVESTYALQHDVRSLLAARVVGRAVAAARRVGEEEGAVLLETWDREIRRDSRAAPLFYSWLFRVRSLVAADEYAPAPEWGFFPVVALLAVFVEGDANPWVDDVGTTERETLASLEERAIFDALEAVGGRAWREVHQERHAHPLSRSVWLQRLLSLDVGTGPTDGGPYTVRPVDYRVWSALDSTSWRPPWTSEYGPSERFVAHVLPAGTEGYFLLPTGQSGNPFSRHYRDMSERWGRGALIPVPVERAAVQRRVVGQFTLTPSGGR